MLDFIFAPEFHLVLYVLFFIAAFSFFSLAPWVPTKSSDLERIHWILSLKKWERFLEIWCGTAKVSAYLAKQNPESNITWIELSPLLYIYSKIKAFFSWANNLNIMYWNALKIDFSKYDSLYVFGLPDTISQKLQPKLITELKNNAKFYSYCFKMTWDSFEQIIHKEQPTLNTLYEYTKK